VLQALQLIHFNAGTGFHDRVCRLSGPVLQLAPQQGDLLVLDMRMQRSRPHNVLSRRLRLHCSAHHTCMMFAATATPRVSPDILKHTTAHRSAIVRRIERDVTNKQPELNNTSYSTK